MRQKGQSCDDECQDRVPVTGALAPPKNASLETTVHTDDFEIRDVRCSHSLLLPESTFSRMFNLFIFDCFMHVSEMFGRGRRPANSV